MCLILLAWQVHPGCPLIVAANRDEFHARRAAPAHFWKDSPSVLAGRDLAAVGTWMGVTRSGKFAAVTNYRGGRDPAARESRGLLTARFLASEATARAYAEGTAARRDDYSGFNLLLADREELWWLSNRGDGARRLPAGIYGLGNLLLDSDETSVVEGKQRLTRILDAAPTIGFLLDLLSPARIEGAEYGTRCATVCLAGGDGGVQYAERSFEPGGRTEQTVRFEFRRSG